jgi:putative methionine-R-sulfoxide reductase with GAF domain
VSASELLEALDRIIARGGDPEDVLQSIVTTIVDRTDAKWAAVLVNEDGELVVGPYAGVAEPGERRESTIVFEGAYCGLLAVDGLDDQPLIERVASLIAPYCNHPEDAS